MGILIDGQWHDQVPLAKTDKQGHFVRPDSAFRGQVENTPNARFPLEADRYHLYISYACPWACSTLIMHQLVGLDRAVSFSSVQPLMLSLGWEFGRHGESVDPVQGKRCLYELYQQTNAQYTGKVTVPVLWDKKQGVIVNNESLDIIHMFNDVFTPLACHDYDAYPKHLRVQIDKMNQWIYEAINNGVYRCGFATTQSAYEQAFDDLFQALDRADAILAQQDYLITDYPTLVDWRLWATLIRFDSVYYSHFKCNRQRINDFPHLSGYLRRLYHYRNAAATVDFTHIKTHYYGSHKSLNPTGIIPKGPCIDGLLGLGGQGV